mgnify:CR=1 FL=1
MQSKSTRGVQQEDVWSAADALIADGLRPTIERVRQKIGRGSPNTVSPMLESWFATLSSRLGMSGVKPQTSNTPVELQQIAENLWSAALKISRQEALDEISQSQHALSEAKQALQLREDELLQKERVLAAQYSALEAARRAAVEKSDDLMSRLTQMQVTSSKRDMEVEILHKKLNALDAERESERQLSSEAAKQHQIERQKYQERSDAMQRKFLEEIDNARQEVKRMRAAVVISENRMESDRNLLQAKIQSQEKELSTSNELSVLQTIEINNQRHALAIANSRSAASETTITRLTDALSFHVKKTGAEPKLMVRKVKRPIRNR